MYKKQDGFTLIELLIVIAIIGILAGIAIPSFIVYRSNGFTAQTVSDMKNAVTAEEAVLVDTGSYTNVLADLLATGYMQNAKVTTTLTTPGNGFTITMTHSSCGASTWEYDSVVSEITGGPCNP